MTTTSLHVDAENAAFENSILAHSVEIGPIVSFNLPVSGDENTVFRALSPFFASYVARKSSNFVGREHLFAHIQNFLANNVSGYLTLTGDPGIGKSALLSKLTTLMQCTAFFFVRSDGVTDAKLFHDYLSAALKARFGIEAEADPSTSPSVRLQILFRLAAKALNGNKLIIVIDALDECDDLNARSQLGNVLFLPRDPPPGVFFIVSRRVLDPRVFNIRIETEPDVGNEVCDLMTFEAENRHDVETYLKAYFDEHPIYPWLQRHHLAVTEAVSVLADRSAGNFMYLRHILPYLASHPSDFAPESLPRGLEEYYSGHWRRMVSLHGSDPDNELVLRTAYLLAVAKKPLTAPLLTQMLKIPSAVTAQQLFDRWREFLQDDGNKPTGYRIYHSSFAEFLERQDAVDGAGRWTGAHRTLSSWLLTRLGRRPLG